MKDKGTYGIKPIKFLNIDYLGKLGKDWAKTDFNLSKLSTQNILYSTYHEPKTIDEIAYLLGMQKDFVADEVYFLEDSGLIDKVAKGKYSALALFHDLSVEVMEERHRIYSKYAKTICENYFLNSKLKKHFKELLASSKIYSPQNDQNFLLWSIISFTCAYKFQNHKAAEEQEKHYVKNKDGSQYIASIEIDKGYDLTFKPEKYLFRAFEINELKPKELYPFSFWLCGTYYDQRSEGWTRTLLKNFIFLYDYFADRIKISGIPDLSFTENLYAHYDEIACMSLFEDKFLCWLPNAPKPYVNMIISTLQKDELLQLIPDVPAEFLELSENLAEEIYQTSKDQYPPRMQEVFRDINKTAFSSGEMITRVLEHLLSINVLKPLTDTQQKTVNMIMFSDVML